jgi:hypothetical protein
MAMLLVVGAACVWPTPARAQVVLSQNDVPVTISKPGSYILGSNLRVSDPTVDAIRVAASDVTIDLNGFTIIGPPLGPTSNGSAIENVGGQSNVVVRNGSIRGFFESVAACIHLGGGHGNRVEDVRVHQCGGIAIYVDGVVTRCAVTDSASGIGVGSGSVAADNTLFNIEGSGVHTVGTSGGITIARNTFHAANPGATCIRSWGANRIEDNFCHEGWAGLVLTGGANFYLRNFLFGSVAPIVDGGGNNVDGGDVDPALTNLAVPAPPVR